MASQPKAIGDVNCKKKYVSNLEIVYKNEECNTRFFLGSQTPLFLATKGFLNTLYFYCLLSSTHTQTKRKEENENKPFLLTLKKTQNVQSQYF